MTDSFMNLMRMAISCCCGFASSASCGVTACYLWVYPCGLCKLRGIDMRTAGFYVHRTVRFRKERFEIEQVLKKDLINCIF